MFQIYQCNVFGILLVIYKTAVCDYIGWFGSSMFCYDSIDTDWEEVLWIGWGVGKLIVLIKRVNLDKLVN